MVSYTSELVWILTTKLISIFLKKVHIAYPIFSVVILDDKISDVFFHNHLSWLDGILFGSLHTGLCFVHMLQTYKQPRKYEIAPKT